MDCLFLAFIVGIGAGIVGAGGAFLLVPIMLTILKIPTRMTIASSLAITLISSIGAITGKNLNGTISILPALIRVIASLLASPLGANAGKRMNKGSPSHNGDVNHGYCSEDLARHFIISGKSSALNLLEKVDKICEFRIDIPLGIY